MSVEHIKLSKKAKDQLVRLKVITGIQQWNVLCRWAFCISLAERTPPARTKIVTDSNVEMSWKVFGGEFAEIYDALLRERCISDGIKIDEHTFSDQFKLHLHRGISYLAGNKKLSGIQDMISLETHRGS